MRAFALQSWLIGIARLARRWQCPYESTFSINYLDFQYKHPRSPGRGAKALDARAKFVHCLEASIGQACRGSSANRRPCWQRQGAASAESVSALA